MQASVGPLWYEEFYKNCESTSLASIPNVTYQPNGETNYGKSHQKLFRVTDKRSGKDIKLYGIIDGFEDGQSIAEFVAERLISEILPPDSTGPHVMNSSPTDSEIKTLLSQAFRRVDSAYFSDCIGETLARRCALQMIPGGSEDIELYNRGIKGFATAVVALIYDNRLFVANLGDSRVIVVKKVGEELKVTKVCAWHHPSDAEERKRLSKLELNPNDVATPTRCFGDFFRKWGYKEIPALKKALGEPILADPSVQGPILLDSAMRYLILMNGGVVQSIMEKSDLSTVNVNVATSVAKEFAGQFVLSVVARAVLDSIAREHQTAFIQKTLPSDCNVRRGISLLVTYVAEFMSEKPLPNSATPVATQEQPPEDEERDTTPSDVDDEGRVQAYVDFSGFYTHPLKDEVLRNIAAIRKKYRDRDLKQSRLSEADEE